jgi:peptidyl-prolyl cis-trans isomerase SurA
MRVWMSILALSFLLRAAVVLDRIAVVAGQYIIKLSDVDRDIRLADFLNRAPLDFSPAARKEAAERLIAQQIIRDEIVSGGYRRPPESQASALESELLRARFAGSSQRLNAEVQRYGLTEAELHEQLLWQITVLQFIDQRFRAGVVITDDDVRKYYDQHASELKRQYPQDGNFQALEPKIRSTLEGERINQAFNEWLDQARQSEKVEFKPGAFT